MRGGGFGELGMAATGSKRCVYVCQELMTVQCEEEEEKKKRRELRSHV